MKSTPPSPSSPSKCPVHQTQVLICGSGSAGLMIALWLAKYKIPFRILEQRAGPLMLGKADGVQCRTVEIFESFGIVDALLRESYHVLELAFWGPDGGIPLVGGGGEEEGGGGGIKRSHFAPDTEPGLSHQPHVILNQARINGLLTEEMLRCGGTEVDYGYEVQNVAVDATTAGDPEAYPVTVTAVKDGVEEVFHAKYAVGCDGAHSAIRHSLGIKMLGDSSNAIWGVADVYPRTNFPDIRKKCVIQSTAGTLIIIPREGDALVRFYIEFPPSADATSNDNNSSSSSAKQNITKETIHKRAQLIFRPYTLDIAETAWWSAYSIGQRLAERFDDGGGFHRVLLTGDACHTHSPKAGQGMNLSLQDGYSLGWKLGAYLSGQVSRDVVKTHVSERYKVARELIEFDREWTRLFKTEEGKQEGGRGADFMRDAFVRSGRYTAGQAYQYDGSILVWPEQEKELSLGQAKNYDPAKNADRSATSLGIEVGMRFPSAQVVRHSDAKVFQLLSVIKSDCRWRVVVFDGDLRRDSVKERLDVAGERLEAVIREFTPQDSDLDSLIEPLLVLKGERRKMEGELIPKVFRPVTGKHKMTDVHKVFVDDASYNSGHGHAFETLGVSPHDTTVVVIRPDQFVSAVLPGIEIGKLSQLFGGFMVPGLEQRRPYYS